MVREYIMKYRGFPSFTPEVKDILIQALSIGCPIDTACERAGISRDTFYRWMRAGKAIHHGTESPDLPHFLPRQPNEDDAAWETRLTAFQTECGQLADCFLTTMKTLAESRYQLHKGMWDRAHKSDDMFPTAWLLERTVPEHYALVTTNRREVDVKAEIKHSHEVEAFAQLFALLGHGHQQALPPGEKIITLPEGDAVAIDPDHD